MNYRNNNREQEEKDQHEKVGDQFYCGGNIVVICPRSRVPAANRGLSGRGEITEFSDSSARRMRRYLRECLADYTVMVTLTYPCGSGFNGVECKEHLRQFIQSMRRYHYGTGEDVGLWSVFWFMEFQNRGAIHFHMFCTNRYPKEWIARRWYEIVGSEDKRHLTAGTRIEKIKAGRRGMASYAAKYASKQCQKVIPDSVKGAGRFWGTSGYKACVSATTFCSMEAAKHPAVKRRRKCLKDAIKAGLVDGSVIDITKEDARPGVRVYVVKSVTKQNEIIRLNLLLSSTIKLYCERNHSIFDKDTDHEQE